MSYRKVCDVCERHQPHVNVKYSRRRCWGWFKFYEDSQGGYNCPMDVCTSCWGKFEEFCKKGAEK